MWVGLGWNQERLTKAMKRSVGENVWEHVTGGHVF